MALETVVAGSQIEIKTSPLQSRVVSTGSNKRVFVVDQDLRLHYFYKTYLEEIVGRGNVLIFGDYKTAMDTLKSNIFSAYVIDPYLPIGVVDNWGFEFVQYVYRREGNYDLVWSLSARHDLLKTAEARGIRQVYTKKDPEEAEGYKTKEDFLNDIKLALSGEGNTTSDTRH